MSLQQNTSTRLDTFRVTEKVEGLIDSGFGRRSFESQAIVTGGRNIRPLQREFLSFSGPGDEFRPDLVGRRRNQMLSAMPPEIRRLFDSFIFSDQLFARFRLVEDPSIVERDGVEYWRFDAVSRERLGPPGRPGPPEGRGRPGSQGRADGQGPPGGQGPPEHLTAWFDAVNFQLRATLQIIRLPARGMMSIRTNYETIQDLDVPVRRLIEGSIPVRRRMRMFRSDIEQDIRYSNYELKFEK